MCPALWASLGLTNPGQVEISSPSSKMETEIAPKKTRKGLERGISFSPSICLTGQIGVVGSFFLTIEKPVDPLHQGIDHTSNSLLDLRFVIHVSLFSGRQAHSGPQL